MITFLKRFFITPKTYYNGPLIESKMLNSRVNLIINKVEKIILSEDFERVMLSEEVADKILKYGYDNELIYFDLIKPRGVRVLSWWYINKNVNGKTAGLDIMINTRSLNRTDFSIAETIGHELVHTLGIKHARKGKIDDVTYYLGSLIRFIYEDHYSR